MNTNPVAAVALQSGNLGELKVGADAYLQVELERRQPQISRYMELAARFGLNVQPGQEVRIECERVLADNAHKLAAAAYDLGAKYVEIDFREPMMKKIRVEHGRNADDLTYIPEWMRQRGEHWVNAKIARIVLTGEADPDLLSKTDPKKLAAMNGALVGAHKRYIEEVSGLDKAQWCVMSLPTTRWAEKIFPGIPPHEAYIKLWDAIIAITRVDTPDWEARWAEHDKMLQGRCEILNRARFDSFHFVGPGTDFTVGMSPLSKFLGGSATTPEGVRFFANLPTDEVFSTPDWRRTEGKVTTTRPFYLNGALVEGLVLEFSKGEIVSFTAKSGTDAFGKQIEIDPGAKRLGEVAIVPIDSPVNKSGIVFQQTLFDENAACHIAIGRCYPKCLDGGESFSEEQLAAAGGNDSVVHSDMMISSEQVDVFGIRPTGERVLILDKGKWVAS